MGVARDVLEPFGRVARRRLQAKDFDLAFFLVGLKDLLDVGIAPLEVVGQIIASSSASLVPEPMEKCAEWAASPISTMLSLLQVSVSTRGKLIQTLDPRRWLALDMSGMAIEMVGEQLLAEPDALVRVHLAEPGGLPGLVGGFDDEGRGVRVELVGVNLEPAPLGLLEDEGEGVQQLLGAEPDELVGPDLDIRLEVIGI